MMKYITENLYDMIFFFLIFCNRSTSNLDPKEKATVFGLVRFTATQNHNI